MDATAKIADVTEDVAVDGVVGSDGSEETDDEQAEKAVAGLDFAVSRVVERLQRLDTDADSAAEADAVAESSQDDEAGPRDWLRLLLSVLQEDGPVSVASEQPEPSLLAAAVAAWAARLEPVTRIRIQRHFAADVTRWLDRLCRWPDASCVLSPSEAVSVAIVLRRVLLSVAAGDDDVRLPVIYAQADHLSLVQRICAQLSLPAACAAAVAGEGRVDPAALERLVRKDVAAGRRPLALLSAPGDAALHRACADLGLWLHLRGSGLARLVRAPHDSEASSHADSISVPLCHWLATPGLDYAVLHRPVGEEEEESEEDSTPLIGWLPVWAELAARGASAVEERILSALALTDDVAAQLAHTPHLQIMADEGGAEVIFRFAAGEDQQLDRLNTWLGQMLARDCPAAAVGSVLSAGRVWLRHCPLECRAAPRWLPELRAQLEILAATAALSPAFRRLAAASARLTLVDVPGWAGLGGVVYGADGLTDDQSDRLNAALVDKLRVTDSAFSLGETAEGRLCVRFAMVTHETDVAELLSLVEATGQQVEDAAQALTNMADIVKKGIEEATLELQKEAEERVWQQGVLRQVPVVGSLLNWWSPTAGDAVKGRRLDLAAGGVVTPTTHISSQ